MAKKVRCPACGSSFELDEFLEVEETTFCPDCDEELEIVSLDPPQVKAVDDDKEEEDSIEEDDN